MTGFDFAMEFRWSGRTSVLTTASNNLFMLSFWTFDTWLSKPPTDVVQRSGAEFAVELFGSELAEVVDCEGPQVENIVPGEVLPFLHQHHLGSQQRELNGCSQPTRSSTQHQTLEGGQQEQTCKRKKQAKKKMTLIENCKINLIDW